MNVSQLRKKAEAMIAKGHEDYQRRVGNPVDTAVTVNLKTGETDSLSIRRRSVDREEYSRTFGDARDLLLKHGYEKTLAPKIQELYAELIPESGDLKTKKRGILKDLRSRDEAKRLAAAKECAKAARGVGKIGWDVWPKNPIVVESLLKALEKEKSTKVAEELIIALGGIHQRYYADGRIPQVLIALFDSEDRSIKRTAIHWTWHMRDRAKWPKIIEILESHPTTPILRAALWHVNSRTPVGVRRKLRPILLETANRKLGAEAKSDLYDSILNMVDDRTKAEYQAAMADQKQLRKALTKYAARRYGKKHDRFQYLQKNLLR